MAILVLAVCSAAASADVTDNTTAVKAHDLIASQLANHNSTNANSIHKSITNINSVQKSNSNADNIAKVNSVYKSVTSANFSKNVVSNASKYVNAADQPSNVVISGKVTKCSDGTPFEGATVTASKDGTELASTTTGEDGTYTLGFPSTDNEFTVTASYPGHEPSSKEVTVNPDSKGNLEGSADFQLGPGDTYVYNGWVTNPSQDVTFPDGTTTHLGQPGTYTNVEDGVANASSGGTVYIADSTTPYTVPPGVPPGGITIDKDLNIVGQSQAGTVITGGGTSQMFNITPHSPSYTVTLQNLTLKNGKATDGGAIFNNGGNLTVNNCTFTDNKGDSRGGAIQNYGTLNVTDCTFTGNTASDALIFGGGAIYSEGTLNVTDSDFEGNTATYGGGAIANRYGTLTITDSNFEGNTATVNGGAITNEVGTVTAHFNRIVGNSPGNSEIYNNDDTGGTVDATLNWWGSNDDPSGKVVGDVDVDPWLVLTVTADPTTIYNRGTSQVTADLQHDSDGVYHDPALGHVPDGIPITLTTDWGSFTHHGITHSITLDTVDGNVSTTFYANEGLTPKPPLNPVEITATADDATVSTFITILSRPINFIGNTINVTMPILSPQANAVIINSGNSTNINTLDPVIISANINRQVQITKRSAKIVKKHKRHYKH